MKKLKLYAECYFYLAIASLLGLREWERPLGSHNVGFWRARIKLLRQNKL